MSSPQKNLVLLGTFIHSTAPNQLEYLHNTAIGVDARGKIVGIEKTSKDVTEAQQRLLKSLGWGLDEVDIRACTNGQFFFPGFIGRSINPVLLPRRDSGEML